MRGGAGQREQGGRVEDHDVVDLHVSTGDLAEQSEGEVGVLGVDRMRHCCVQVVALAGEPRSPLDLSRPAHVTPRASGELREVLRVPAPHPIGLTGVGEAFLGVLADRFQQPVPHLRSVDGDDERTRHELATNSNTSSPWIGSPASRLLPRPSSVHPPENTASRPNSRCSGSLSRS